MITNLSDIQHNDTERSQVCVIGAGVAGQTVAAQLAEANIDVILLESGGTDFNSEIQTMAAGQNIGQTYYDLETTRLRLFGGTAAIWGGRCAELDSIDFEKRDYVPHSGWPISKADLDPYYADVFKSLGLERQGHDDLWSRIGVKKPKFDPQKLDAGLWCFDENGNRFTERNKKPFTQVRTIINATVTSIDVDDSGTVKSVKIQNLYNQCVTIKAHFFVLAAGAIESVRLLMGGVPARPNGLGNQTGQLGRFFMEHPHARGGQILPHDLAKSLLSLPRALRVKGNRYAAYLRPADELQRKSGILNTSLSFAPRRHEGLEKDAFRAAKDKLKHDLPSTKFWRTLYKGLKDVGVKAREFTEPGPSVRKIKRGPDTFGLYAVIRAEQAPNPNSRISLSKDLDALGLRRVNLDWQFSEIDKRSVRVLMETLSDEYQSKGWGEVKPSPWLYDEDCEWKIDPLISSHHIGGYHHMGGTRMSHTARNGVVDLNCRLHESPNFYVASSSVFPTGGWANPTVTIMALAERLADHLKNEIAA